MFKKNPRNKDCTSVTMLKAFKHAQEFKFDREMLH